MSDEEPLTDKMKAKVIVFRGDSCDPIVEDAVVAEITETYPNHFVEIAFNAGKLRVFLTISLKDLARAAKLFEP